MVPIHDTDVAQERWSQAEWQHYELWEKVEVRLRQRRVFWIVATFVVFMLLSSIPTLMEHSPRWGSLHAARVLGQQINLMKQEAGTQNQAFRLEFAANHELSYTISEVPNCAAPAGTGQVVRRGNLVKPGQLDNYKLITPEMGPELGIPGLVDSICYDPLLGSVTTPTEDSVEGFAIIPAGDLPVKGMTAGDVTEGRQDRLSILIFRGPSAEVSFE